MYFSKEHLANPHYNWVNDTGTAVFTGQPSRRLFDRFNGDQVLFIINYYGAASDGFSVQEGRILEDRIANDLPSEAKSEISVFNWLRDAS